MAASFGRGLGLLLLLLGLRAPPASAQQCDETCDGAAPYQTRDIGECLARPLDSGGQGGAVEEALRDIYDAATEADIQPGGDGGDAQGQLVRGLNAALPGAIVPNSEGLYYCVHDGAAESFYWVQNCDVLSQNASGNANLCAGLTDDEAGVGTVGYVVDDTLTGWPGGAFVRYVFNATDALVTAEQPLLPYASVAVAEASDPAEGFRCSQRPWYQEALLCENPAKVLCPTDFEGTMGMGTFQTYGNMTNGVVAAQDVAGWQLCECLEDVTCDGSPTNAAGGVHLSVRALYALLLAGSLSTIFWSWL